MSADLVGRSTGHRPTRTVPGWILPRSRNRAAAPTVPLLSMLAVAVVWGATYSQMKQAVAVYPLFGLLALRFAVASLALAAAPWRGRTSAIGAVKAGLPLGFALAAAYALQTLALEQTSATATAFTTGLFVPLTPLLAAALFRERILPRSWVAAALASVGLFLLAGGSGGPVAANLLALAGAACFALHLLLTARAARSHDPTRLVLVQMTVCASLFALAALATEPLERPSGLSLWTAILVTGLLASGLAFTVQTWAQRKLTATQTAIVITAEPVFAALAGFALAGEQLNPAVAIGSVAILAAITLGQSTLSPRQPTPRSHHTSGLDLHTAPPRHQALRDHPRSRRAMAPSIAAPEPSTTRP